VVVGFCEHGNEPSVSIRKQVYEKRSDYQLFKEYHAPWSE
jgi:hypothetical protein